MSGWGDLILDTEHARREWVWGFEGAVILLDECHPRWLDKLYHILRAGGDWAQGLGWDYNAYNEGLILGLYGLVALQHLDQAL